MEELLEMNEQVQNLSLKVWLSMANFKDLRSCRCFMVGDKSLNNLAPKFARAKLNLSFYSLRPSLLPGLVSVFNFSGKRLWSINGAKFSFNL